MIKPEDLVQKATEEAFETFVIHMNDNSDAYSEKFAEWGQANALDLKRIYMIGIENDDEEIILTSFLEWCRKMFIIVECNAEFDKEMEALMGNG